LPEPVIWAADAEAAGADDGAEPAAGEPLAELPAMAELGDMAAELDEPPAGADVTTEVAELVVAVLEEPQAASEMVAATATAPPIRRDLYVVNMDNLSGSAGYSIGAG
jgi:hypothetical protein